jgi:hypothetical protein
MTLDADFWQLFAMGVIGLIVLSIVAAAVWVYIFKDQ